MVDMEYNNDKCRDMVYVLCRYISHDNIHEINPWNIADIAALC